MGKENRLRRLGTPAKSKPVVRVYGQKLDPPLQRIEAVLHLFNRGTAVIRYDVKGQMHEWIIGADPDVDNRNSLRRHLARNIPHAVFVDAVVY